MYGIWIVGKTCIYGTSKFWYEKENKIKLFTTMGDAKTYIPEVKKQITNVKKNICKIL